MRYKPRPRLNQAQQGNKERQEEEKEKKRQISAYGLLTGSDLVFAPMPIRHHRRMDFASDCDFPETLGVICGVS